MKIIQIFTLPIPRTLSFSRKHRLTITGTMSTAASFGNGTPYVTAR